MQSSSQDRDFSAYNAAQEGRPVRPLAVRAVEAGAVAVEAGTAAVEGRTVEGENADAGALQDAKKPPHRRIAVELGSGIGIEARFLAEHGYEVWTYDTDPAVEPALRELADHHPIRHTTTALESLDQLPVADLLLSCATLSFVPRTGFDALWRTIREAVRPGGMLAIDLFGEQDDWAGTDGTFVSRAEVDELLQGWAHAEVEEKEYDGRSFAGPKHWHTVTVLARR